MRRKIDSDYCRSQAQKMYLRDNLEVEEIARRLGVAKSTVFGYLRGIYVRAKYLEKPSDEQL